MQPNQESRLHDRVTSEITKYIKLTQNQQEIGKIKDLSYGGMLVESHVPDVLQLPNRTVMSIDFSIMHVNMPITANKIYCRGNEIGFSFNHSTLIFLNLLRDILEYQRIGESAREIKDKSDDEKYMHICGESSLHLIVKSTEKAGSCDYFLSFFADGKLAEVNCNTQGHVLTGLVGGKSDLPGAIAHVDAKVDKAILLKAFSLLLNMSHIENLKIHLEKILPQIQEKLMAH